MTDNVRLHVYFRGTVQGVGFRFYTERVARNFSLSGFVRNLPDGSVEVTAEGEKKVLERFLDNLISGSLGPYISSKDVSWDHPTGEFKDFTISYW